jgi:hypothetical protein
MLGEVECSDIVKLFTVTGLPFPPPLCSYGGCIREERAWTNCNIPESGPDLYP